MSLKVLKFSRGVTGICALAVVSACQDALAPMEANAPTGDQPTLLASRGGNVARELVKDQYIVVFREGYNDVDARSSKLMKGNNAKIKHAFKAGVKGFAASMSAEEAAAIAQDKSVAYVEQDQVVTIGVGKPSGGGPVRKGKPAPVTVAPSDSTPAFTQTPVPSWGLDRIDQSAAILDNRFTYSATGVTVNAYIIDSGIRITHADFQGRASADFSVIADGYGAIGCNWHGSHVAGTVGGTTSGVAKAVRLHSVRVLDCNNSGTVSGVAAGIDWVVANRSMPAVINLSIEAASSQFLVDAVDRAISAGITVVVAAGNNSADACAYSPANAAAALTVGATNSVDQMAAFSNQGSCVDLMAPGQFISSVSNIDDGSFLNASGTSMAAPHATGSAALYLERNPLAQPAAVVQAIKQKMTIGALSGIQPGSPNALLRSF